ncbi:sulfite oxidase [Methylopila jiangsuensis]|jgi:sulfite oxidase|uniref:Sulfite oxidase n=1 Tax=Methylopila jiangsuensis TaxID=586230 RepID=A0A9W6JF98_9HYPH|nr:molybdopterin-dependent oxidoreductase [Methylopila jiangsuensis]MDR6287030.1 sulfite oxidase [Methylopila jiangsuensis]GLK76516.1 sulfite oxidase [Methylopila jiangsuensis]
MLDKSHRKPGQIVHSEAPFNAEPTLDRLRQSFLTPEENFYVRSHGDIPDLEADGYRLTVGGMVATELSFTLAELMERFPNRSVIATMQCAGNRRADLHRHRPVSGDPWEPGAIGNARWTGIALCDVLRAAGVDERQELHVAFESHDVVEQDGERFRFGVSIAMEKALDPDTLLATQMNDAPLPAEHGRPLRLVVPGFAGVRSPKWLASITIQDAPSSNPMQAEDYKLFPSHLSKETADPSDAPAIEALPINAAICEPAAGAKLPAGETTVRGYAVACDRLIRRVDVSADGGESWTQAELSGDPEAPFAWMFWTTRLDLAPGAHELVVRAWDAAGQTQPSRPEHVWNFKGYLGSCWHRVTVTVT